MAVLIRQMVNAQSAADRRAEQAADLSRTQHATLMAALIRPTAADTEVG
jgi:hypothetical protein